MVDNLTQKQSSIKDSFDEIVNFKINNPEQNRSGCLFQQDGSGQTLRNYQIEDEVFKACNFYTAQFIGCKFIKCTFLDINFIATRMINVKFIECTFNNCDFSDSELTDVGFMDCNKQNCAFNHVHRNGNCKGIKPNKDNKVIDDMIQEEDEDTEVNENPVLNFNTKIKTFMNKYFPKWIEYPHKETQYADFVLYDPSQAVMLAFHPNPSKNTTDTDEFCELSFMFNNQSLLTTDFNIFGQTDEQLQQMINNWIQDVIEDEAKIILSRMIEIMTK